MASVVDVNDYASVTATVASSREPPATLQTVQDAVHAQGVLLQHMLDQLRTTQAHVEELHESLTDVASLLSGGGGGGGDSGPVSRGG